MELSKADIAFILPILKNSQRNVKKHIEVVTADNPKSAAVDMLGPHEVYLDNLSRIISDLS